MNIPRSEHPNPQFMRQNWICLNGEWQFEIDHGVSGFDRGLHEADSLKDRIIVPFCPESGLSGIGYTDFMYQVWYKKTVPFEKAALVGKRVILHFGAADYRTTVWINGAEAVTKSYPDFFQTLRRLGLEVREV